MIRHNLVEYAILPDSRKALVFAIRTAIKHPAFSVPKQNVKAKARQCSHFLDSIHKHSITSSANRVNPHNILAVHAKLPIQHQFIRTQVNECLGIAQLPTGNLSRKDVSFGYGQYTFIITLRSHFFGFARVWNSTDCTVWGSMVTNMSSHFGLTPLGSGMYLWPLQSQFDHVSKPVWVSSQLSWRQ